LEFFFFVSIGVNSQLSYPTFPGRPPIVEAHVPLKDLPTVKFIHNFRYDRHHHHLHLQTWEAAWLFIPTLISVANHKVDESDKDKRGLLFFFVMKKTQ